MNQLQTTRYTVTRFVDGQSEKDERLISVTDLPIGTDRSQARECFDGCAVSKGECAILYETIWKIGGPTTVMIRSKRVSDSNHHYATGDIESVTYIVSHEND